VEKKNGLPNEWFRDSKSTNPKASGAKARKPKSLNKRQIAWVFLGAFSYWFVFLLIIALLQRSDTIIIMSVPKIGTPLQLTSIPRDLVVTIPARGDTGEKKNKINAAYAFGGPSLSLNTVEKLVGVQMDNYAEIGFAGLVNVVNSFGGIKVCPSQDFSDKKSGLEIKEGCQTVDGLTALAYSRMRYADPKGDIGRGERQQEVVN